MDRGAGRARVHRQAESDTAEVAAQHSMPGNNSAGIPMKRVNCLQ